jgi:outer membrane efflux protein
LPLNVAALRREIVAQHPLFHCKFALASFSLRRSAMKSYGSSHLMRPMLIGSILTLSLAGGSVTAAAPDDPASDEVKSLLKERLAIVTTIYEQRLAAHKQGATSLEQVTQARADLLRAKLDLCETKDERLAVHAEMVKLAEDSLQAVESVFKSGVIPQGELLKVKLELLEARLGLARAKAAK